MAKGMIIAILVGGFMVGMMGLLVFMFFLREKFAKEVVGHIVVTYIPVAGEARHELCPVDNGLVIFTNPKMQTGKAWLVSSISQRPAHWPLGWHKLIAAATTQVWVNEQTLEPISNLSGKKEFTPAGFFSQVNQKFLTVITEAQRILEQAQKVRSNQTSTLTYVVLVLVLAAVALSGGSLYFNQKAQQDVKMIKLGMGVVEEPPVTSKVK